MLDIERQIAVFAYNRLNKWSRVHWIHIVAAAGELERSPRIKTGRTHLKTAVFSLLLLGLYGPGLWPHWPIGAAHPLPWEERGTFLLGFQSPLFHRFEPLWGVCPGITVKGKTYVPLPSLDVTVDRGQRLKHHNSIGNCSCDKPCEGRWCVAILEFLHPWFFK